MSNSHWNAKNSTIYIIIVLLLTYVGIIISSYVFKAGENEAKNQVAHVLLSYGITLSVMILPILLIAYMTQVHIRKAIIIEKCTIREVITTLFRGYGLLLGLAAVVGLITTYIYPIQELPGFHAQKKEILELKNALPVTSIIVVLIAPVVEEIIFRGLVLKSYLQSYPPWIASIITAFFFSAMHLQFDSFWWIFILGIIINYLYIKAHCKVFPVIIFHTINNAVALYVHTNFTV